MLGLLTVQFVRQDFIAKMPLTLLLLAFSAPTVLVDRLIARVVLRVIIVLAIMKPL